MTEQSMNAMQQAPEEARQQWLGMMETYMQLLNTPGSYLQGQAEQQQQNLQQSAQQWMEQAQQQSQTFQEQAQEQQQAFQQMTQEVMGTYAQLFNIPLSYAKQSLRESGFPIENYDSLNADEISRQISTLSAEELRVVRDYEERNKNRETVLEQLDRRIRSGS